VYFAVNHLCLLLYTRIGPLRVSSCTKQRGAAVTLRKATISSELVDQVREEVEEANEQADQET
jgi:hypothetical protein